MVGCASTSPGSASSKTSNQNLKTKATSSKERPTSNQQPISPPKCDNPKYAQAHFEKQGVVFGKPVKSAARSKDSKVFSIHIRMNTRTMYRNKQRLNLTSNIECSRNFIILKLGQTTVGAVIKPNQTFVKILDPGIYLQTQHRLLEINWKANLLTRGFIHKHFSKFSIQIWTREAAYFFQTTMKWGGFVTTDQQNQNKNSILAFGMVIVHYSLETKQPSADSDERLQYWFTGMLEITSSTNPTDSTKRVRELHNNALNTSSP